MRLTLAIAFALFALAQPAAWGVAISNIQFDPASEAALQFAQHVNVTFDYSVDQAAGVRIYARPFTHGALSPNYAASGSPLYPQGDGAGNGWFTISGGAITVDDVRFQVWNADNTVMLLEFFVSVRFHFSNHGIYHIAMTPASPSSMMYGQRVDISFDYITNYPGNVLIFARPFTEGHLTPGYSASGSPLYPSGSGSGTHWFTITHGPEVRVDEVRFQMLNAAQTELLLEFFVPVAYDYDAGSVYNIAYVPVTPGGLIFHEDAAVSFEYWTVVPEGVRIFARPYTNGAPTPNYAASGSPVYPSGHGLGGGTFTILTGEVTVDAIKFTMTNAAQTETILEYFVPVNLHFAGHAIRSIDLDHSSPAYFTYDHSAYMDLPYTTSWPAGVLIWPIGVVEGSLYGYYSGSPVWPTGNGVATDRYIGASNGPVIFDQVWLLMRDPDQTVDLVSWYVPVKLSYGNRVPTGVTEPIAQVAPVALFASFENPVQAGTQIRYTLPSTADVSLKVLDIEGRTVCTLVDGREAAGDHVAELPRTGLPSGIYFMRLEAVQQPSGEQLFDGRRVVLVE